MPGSTKTSAYLVALMPGTNDPEIGIHSIILEKWRVPYPPPPKKNLTGLEELPCYFPRLISSYDEVMNYLRNQTEADPETWELFPRSIVYGRYATLEEAEDGFKQYMKLDREQRDVYWKQ